MAGRAGSTNGMSRKAALTWAFALAAVALLASPAPPHFGTMPSGEAEAVQDEAQGPAPGPPAEAPTLAKATPAEEPPPSFQVRSILNLAPLELGEYAWDDDGVPDGPIEVVVDLVWQRLYVYQGGIEIGRSSILYGAADSPTPTGIFPITQKDADHVSNIYGAPMPYMLRLTWDGVAIHGSKVRYGWATNGCVGVPEEFARLLFRKARLGDRVLITNYWHRDLYHNT